ncbi:ABC transporter, transmembrane domain, type 1 [Akanthomyces lecanii RCEF 1005]|uniref:ABC transporter, transmembrane domain, type 1 n=1 Tax=Akanthomyces lecanii RCEF 1005 TaxID=1081108 RepID=A0A168FEG3_CORDF|nr:ABC transporter, transmembrane domain, type 1 [Akanthomyces lecanii RCEF 1005]
MAAVAVQLAIVVYCSVGVVAMAYASHVYFLQPILFLSAFLSITLVFDLVTIYTYLHRTGLDTLARLTCVLPSVKFLLVILEEISKRSLISAENRDQLGSEITAGFWSRSTFLWINPLLLFGFRHIVDNDTLPDIGHQFGSNMLYHNFKICWDKQDQKAKRALFKTLIFAAPWPFFYAILPRLFLVGFNFSQPFLLQDVVNVVADQPTQPDKGSRNDEVIGLILATALVFSGKAVSRNWFSHIRTQIMVSIRGTLVSAIYQKSLRISAAESEESAAVTLMSTDVEGVGSLVSLCYDTCAVVLEVGFGIGVLTIFVGAASIFTVITALRNEHIADRVAATSNMLAQIKDIKMTGLALSMATHLHHLRAKEVAVSLNVRRINCITFGISAFAETITPALVVAATLFWTREAQTMSSARFYTIIAVVSMVSQPLAAFFANLPNWATGFACLDRIQTYLARDEARDPRRVTDYAVSVPTDATGLRRRGTRATAVSYTVQLRAINVALGASDSVLSDATISIKAGDVTMIHGSVGCGKSTLLKAMLGEMAFKSGTAVISSPSIAFAGQRPWLLNTTIRLNIIGRKSYDRTLYQRIIFVCDLASDLERLPNGDQTLAGSAGCNLGGGQKQRIALARAFYMEAETTILDDPFSSLDQQTAVLIRTRLFTDGFATEGGKTLVMTTSTKQHLVDADNVFRVTEEGHVQYITPAQIDIELEDLVQASRSQARPLIDRGESAAEPFKLLPLVQSSIDEDSHDMNKAKVHNSFSLYAYYFRPAGIFVIAVWLALTIFASISERLPNIFARIWLDAYAGDHRYYAGYAVFCVLYPIMNSLSAMFFFYFIIEKVANKLHENLVNTTFRAAFEFLSNEDASSILNRFSQDTSMVTMVIPGRVLPTVFRAVSIFVDIGIISAGATYAAPVIPLYLLHILAVQQYYLHTSRQLRLLELDTAKALVRQFTETAAGIEHIRAFRWQEEVIQDVYSTLDLTQRPLYFLYSIQQWLEGVLDFSSAVAAVLVVTFALKFPSSASANSMGLALLSLIRFSDTISDWVQSSVAMETAFGAVSRIKSYCSETPVEKYQDGEGPIPSDWPSHGQIELKNVSARYRSAASPEGSQIKDATVVVRPGETLGIVGRTGGGKTTVLLSVLNLLEYKGEINIDDREIRTIPPDILRSRITTVTQGGIYLRGTVKFNLDPFSPALRPSGCTLTEEMREDALRRVGLWQIIKDRGGLTESMKDMGLSLGQRQLFQLARAILHHEVTGSKIVLMDEVTAGLDEGTEERIAVILDDAFRGCARVVISHRMPTLDSADAIMVMNQGQAQVVEHRPGDTNWAQYFEQK